MTLTKKERETMRAAASCSLCEANVPLAKHLMRDRTVQAVHVYSQDKHPHVDLRLEEVAQVRMMLADTTHCYLVCHADAGTLALLDDLDAKDEEIKTLKMTLGKCEATCKLGTELSSYRG